ncbi:MAG: monofunctional biosynthetic peptidoglycan transglycosylase [Bacteroidota bacterium]
MKWSVFKKIIFRSIIGFFAVSFFSVLLFKFIPVPVTPLMLIRCAEQSVSGKEICLTKDWTSLDKLGNNIQVAVITSEDQRFEEHFGFDFEAIEKAQEYNEKHNGKKIRGASTISQQTAKNVFLWPSRSWVRKGFEVYFTFLIELLWSKERILEVYLNVIETGSGVYGAEAAAVTFFKKPSSKLTSMEAALIAAVLPNPRKWSPAKPSGYVRRRATAINRMMGYVRFNDE